MVQRTIIELVLVSFSKECNRLTKRLEFKIRPSSRSGVEFGNVYNDRALGTSCDSRSECGWTFDQHSIASNCTWLSLPINASAEVKEIWVAWASAPAIVIRIVSSIEAVDPATESFLGGESLNCRCLLRGESDWHLDKTVRLKVRRTRVTH